MGDDVPLGARYLGTATWDPLFFLAVTKQLNDWFSPSVCLSVAPFSLCSHHHIIMKFSGVITMDRSDVHAKVQGQRSRSQRSKPNLAVSGPQFEFTYGNEIMHTAWSSIEEVPYRFSRSSVKCQGHTRQKIANFDPNLVFPDYNYSLNWPMAVKWCTKLELG